MVKIRPTADSANSFVISPLLAGWRRRAAGRVSTPRHDLRRSSVGSLRSLGGDEADAGSARRQPSTATLPRRALRPDFTLSEDASRIAASAAPLPIGGLARPLPIEPRQAIDMPPFHRVTMRLPSASAIARSSCHAAFRRCYSDRHFASRGHDDRRHRDGRRCRWLITFSISPRGVAGRQCRRRPSTSFRLVDDLMLNVARIESLLAR